MSSTLHSHQLGLPMLLTFSICLETVCSVVVMKAFLNLKTRVCPIIQKLLQNKMVLVHKIAIN